jgi:hypothetical protein
MANASANKESASEIAKIAPITDTDKFLITYLGNRSPVIPLGILSPRVLKGDE